MTKSFRGGIFPDCSKELSKDKPIEKMTLPDKVTLHLQQHIGAPGNPVVEVGQEVRLGQLIGETKAFVSAKLHASVSGKVLSIGPQPHPSGGEVTAIVIENDGQDQWADEITPQGDLDSLTGEDIRNIVLEAGLVGMGGAAFPSHVKLSPPPDKKIHTLIINGCECETFLTNDYRMMVEKPDDIVFGAKAMAKVLNVEKIVIGIEDNKPEAISKLKEAASGHGEIQVVSFEEKYPQGAEKQLIYSLTQKEVPAGGLPMDVGVVVHNVGTAAALSDAIKHGWPLIQRVISVTGPGVKETKNLLVRIGTSVSDIIEYVGGYVKTPGKVILGGTMTGPALHSTDVPILKGTSGIVVLPKEDVRKYEPMPCIRCARCVDTCPSGLMPVMLSRFAKRGVLQEAEQYGVMDCIECGCCSYVCPAKIFLLHWIKLAKNQILAQRRQKG